MTLPTTRAQVERPSAQVADEVRLFSQLESTDNASYACKPCQDWGMDENTDPCRFCKPLKWLAWRIRVDPRIVLRRPDGRLVTPTQPPGFVSCAHPVDGCSTAVRAVEYGRPPGALARAYSLCDLEVVDNPPPPPDPTALRTSARDAYVTLLSHARHCTDCRINDNGHPVVNRGCMTGTGMASRYQSAYELWYPHSTLGDSL